MNSTTWQSRVQLPREESRRRLQDLVGPAQLPDLPLQLGDPLRVHRRGTGPPASVDLRLAYPVPQRLPVDPQLVGHPGHRTHLLPGLLPNLEHHPHGPLTQLVGVPLRY